MPRRKFTSLIRLIVLVVGVAFITWWRTSLQFKEERDLDQHLSNEEFQSMLYNSSSWDERAERVKAAFLHAYGGYESAAFGSDELLPLSEEGSNSYNGWGVSIVDSLDTMILMGLEPQYTRALRHVERMKMNQSDIDVPVFETSIRYLGGLLGAYTLTSEKVFLEKADELGRILLPAFNTPYGIPYFWVNPVQNTTKLGPKGRESLFSELATFQPEFKTLAKLTGRQEYLKPIARVRKLLKEHQGSNGLWPTRWDLQDGVPTNKELACGGTSDSAYEYLLKTWLSDPTEVEFRDMYIRAANGLISNMMYLSPNRNLVYVTDLPNGIFPSYKLEHLSCSLPGILAHGVKTLGSALTAREQKLHMWAAQGIATTCWTIAADQVTGLSPDEIVFSRPRGPAKENVDGKQGLWIDAVQKWEKRNGRGWLGNSGQGSALPPGLAGSPPTQLANERDYWLRKPGYELRPETIESLYFVWKATGEEKWREKGWDICNALDAHTKTPFAYSTIRRVDILPIRWMDVMPSWFLAETLKYCFLIASDADLAPADKYLLNTEAHFLPRFSS
ncbi:hypothetical protein FRC02_009829 [Tulasnella sp. 418]|nr:hypothetical protein FRC02_009829 [Tulasnella sp. 418]